MAMAATEIDRKEDIVLLEIYKSSPDVSMDGSQKEHSQILETREVDSPVLTTETSTQASSTASLHDDNNGESDNDLEEPVEMDENSIPRVIEEISPVDGPCVQCEIEQPCSFRFTDNGETLYVCNEPCIKAYQAEYPGKYTVTRIKYIIEEITPQILLCSECEQNKKCYFYHNFDGEETYYCSVNCLEGMMADEKHKYTFKLKSDTICIDQIRLKAGQCLICEKVKLCKFSLVRYGEPRLLCERACIKILSGRERGRYYIKMLRVSKPAISNAIDKNLDEAKAAAKVQREQSFLRRCSQCTLILLIDGNVLTWEAMDFCDERCLERFQNGIGSRCAKCNTQVQHTSLGKYCVRFGYDIRQFCNSTCLGEFKKRLKICCYCQKNISAQPQVFLAPVGDKGQFKDFCSRSCVEIFDQISKNPVPQPVRAKCAVCSLEKATTIEVEVTETASQRLCSNPCFAAFKFVNNILPDQCKWCKKYFKRNPTKSFTIYDDSNPDCFCSLSCMTIHINHTRFIVCCDRCKSKKYNFDMIRRVGNQSVIMCSLNCLSLHQESENAPSSSNGVPAPTLVSPVPSSAEQDRPDVMALAAEQLIMLTKSRKRRVTTQSSKQEQHQRNESAKKVRFVNPKSPRSDRKKETRSSRSSASISNNTPPARAEPQPSVSLTPEEPETCSASISNNTPPALAEPQPSVSSTPAEPKTIYESGSSNRTRRRRLHQSLIAPNSSSEEEASDDDDYVPCHIPRGLRMLMEADEDTSQEDEVASVRNNEPADGLPLNSEVVNYDSDSESGSSNLTRRPGLQQSLIVPNIGSEDEASDDDEDVPCHIPRGLRMLIEADEDTAQEDEVASVRNNEPADGLPLNSELAEVVDGEMNGLLSLPDFNWREFPTPPISPESRRENFVGSYGPTTGPTSNAYETFVKIWDRPVMEEIARQTNLYAQQYAMNLLEKGEMKPTSRIAKWEDTNVDELYVYFALVMAMGITVKSKLEHYWTTEINIFSTPGFYAQMPLKRFQLLSRCLHFTDNTDCPPNLTRSEAKISKIKPIVDHLNSKFQALYGLGQNIALDESLTQWKGWLDIKQYIPNKAAKVGIKTYEVCDSRSGYLWRFEVHSGGESEIPEAVISGKIPNLVLRLLQGLNNQGHTVWMDNFYNSPALARILKMKGFDCAGTLRTNRQFVPEQIVNLKNSDMKMGQVCGYTSGDVDVMVWRDQREVAMISTYHGLAVSDAKPTLIKEYNVCMGGVDRKDQMLSMYPMERKRTQVWYKKFFRRLLNVSILNAYIIHKHHAQTTHRAFRMELVLGLLQRHEERSFGVLTGRRAPKLSDVLRAHFPVQLPSLPGKRSDKLRRRCVVCKKRTQVTCKACDVALCFNLKSRSTCYMSYHT